MIRNGAALLAGAIVAVLPSASDAQMRTLRIVSSDSAPVMYAFVTVEAGTGQISDDKGEIKLGAGKRKIVTVHARRIGFEPFFSKVELPDTAAVITIVLPSITQQLGAVQVIAHPRVAPSLQSFYDRWLMRQKGALSATFIGPEETEFRHPNKITNMLSGLNGISFRNTVQNELPQRGSGGPIMHGGAGDTLSLSDMNSVPIDRILDANDVAAIEVYTRGGNMPISLQVSDAGCEVIAFWTGSSRP